MAKKNKEGAVLFVCDRFVEPTITMSSATNMRDAGGVTIKSPGHRIQFRKMAYKGSFRGEYETNDPREIEFLREHEWYDNGILREEKIAVAAKDRLGPQDKVTQGLADSGAKEEAPVETPAPIEEGGDVPKVSVPAKLRKGKKAAAAA